MTEVKISKLTKVYPGSTTPSVKNLDLTINSGELTALLGPSGCGKTTTMKMIAGLLQPTMGDITFDGQSILAQKPENRGVVMVFQNYLLFPYMSIADNIGFGLRMRNLPKPEIAARVKEMLELMKLPDLGSRKPAELSGGQQQRVALARALIIRPKVLLLDEPLSNLDAHLRLEMRDLIRSLQQEFGITTIFVTHDQEEAVVLADKVALILDGELRQYDKADAFYKRPVDEKVARFFGGQNFLSGSSDGSKFESSAGSFALGEGNRTGEGVLTFRPESVKVGEAKTNNIRVKVSDRIYLGTQTRLKLAAGEDILDAIVLPDQVEGISVGDEITVNLPPQSLWVLQA